jgi:hypothetical protein
MSTKYRDAVVYEQLTTITCGKCGMAFAVPEAWRAARQAKRDTFWCPNGHPRVYSVTTEDILRKEKAELERRLASTGEDVRAARADAEVANNRTRAYKGHVTRLKNRVGKGRCPACSEEFPNVAEHMHEAHPGYGDEPA